MLLTNDLCHHHTCGRWPPFKRDDWTFTSKEWNILFFVFCVASFPFFESACHQFFESADLQFWNSLVATLCWFFVWCGEPRGQWPLPASKSTMWEVPVLNNPSSKENCWLLDPSPRELSQWWCWKKTSSFWVMKIIYVLSKQRFSNYYALVWNGGYYRFLDIYLLRFKNDVVYI